MANTPEGKVKDKINRTLEAYGAYRYMPVSNGMGTAALDYICCHKGHFFSIEAKAPGKKPTVRQQHTQRVLEHHGARVFIIDGDCTELAFYLAGLSDGTAN